MAVHRSSGHSSSSQLPSFQGTSEPWRNYMPSLLVGQLCFWLILGSLYLSYSSAGETPEQALLLAEKHKVEANVVKLNLLPTGIPGSDKRGWIMSPLHAAKEHGLGGAKNCIDVHVGTIGPGMSRANHRHHKKNESFLVWGARGTWRIEHQGLPSGYAEVELKEYDVTVFTAPVGRAHALINLDKTRQLNLMVCADMDWDPANPDTDYHVWKDL